jgi:hypothetical protein
VALPLLAPKPRHNRAVQTGIVREVHEGGTGRMDRQMGSAFWKGRMCKGHSGSVWKTLPLLTQISAHNIGCDLFGWMIHLEICPAGAPGSLGA